MKRFLLLLGLLAVGTCLCRADGVVLACTQDDLEIALESGGEVTFSEDCSITVSNVIRITEDVIIDGFGNNVVLSGGSLSRIFQIEPGVNVTLLGITFEAGQSTNGGAIYVSPTASLSASNCVFTLNKAIGDKGLSGVDGKGDRGSGESGTSGTDGTPGLGGAIYNAGSLSLVDCRFLTNTAAGGLGGNGGSGAYGSFQGGNGGNGGDGGDALGAAVYSVGTLDVTDCTFQGNSCTAGSAGSGGSAGLGPFVGFPGSGGGGGDASGAGIFSGGSRAVVLGSTFEANITAGGTSQDGGTLKNRFGADGKRGGHAMGSGIYSSTQLSVTNCSFGANLGTGGNGGNGGPGEFTGGDGGNGGTGAGAGITGSGLTIVVNATLSGNSVVGGTNGIAGIGPFIGQPGSKGATRGGNLANLSGTFTLINTIVGTNFSGPSAYGTITDGGKNLLADSSVKLGTTSLIKTDPKLTGLADNGGKTRTFALATNSPAIDAGADDPAPALDQRGMVRPVGPHVDIGAFEYSHVVSGRVTVSNSPLPGVTIQAGAYTAVSDSSGNYRLPVLPGDVQLVPQLEGYSFNPSEVSLSVTSSLANVNFSATRLAVLSGRVMDDTNGLAGVLVSIGTNSVITSSNGSYAITLPPGQYTVTPVKDCYQFQPTNIVLTVNSRTNQANFVATSEGLIISGGVFFGNQPLAGVAINAGGRSTVTDTNGSFALKSLCHGDYTVTPSLTGYLFAPASLLVSIPPSTNLSFTAFQSTVTGSVSEAGQPLSGVQLRLTSTALTNSTQSVAGAYIIPGLTYNTDYTLVPSLPGYTFTPSRADFTPTSTLYTIDFKASPLLGISAAPGTNLLLTFSGSTGRVYSIEASTNLATWETIATNTSPIFFEDYGATNYPSRFYRMR